jgi:hypothetical protein
LRCIFNTYTSEAFKSNYEVIENVVSRLTENTILFKWEDVEVESENYRINYMGNEIELPNVGPEGGSKEALSAQEPRKASPTAGPLAGAQQVSQGGVVKDVADRRLKGEGVVQTLLRWISTRHVFRIQSDESPPTSVQQVPRSPISVSQIIKARMGRMLSSARSIARGFFSGLMPKSSSGTEVGAEMAHVGDTRRIHTQTEAQKFPHMEEVVQGIDPDMTQKQRSATESAYKKEYKKACERLDGYQVSENTKKEIAHGIATRAAGDAYREAVLGFSLPSYNKERHAALIPPEGVEPEYFEQLAHVLDKQDVIDKDVRDVAITLSKMWRKLFEYALSKEMSSEDAEKFAGISTKYVLSHWDEVETKGPLLIECSNVYAVEYFNALDDELSESDADNRAEKAATRFREARETLRFPTIDAEVYVAAYFHAESSKDVVLPSQWKDQREEYNKHFALGCVLAGKQTPPIIDFNQRLAFGQLYAILTDRFISDKRRNTEKGYDSSELELCATEFAKACAQRCPASEQGGTVEAFMGSLGDAAGRFLDHFDTEKSKRAKAGPELPPQELSRQAAMSALQKLW